MAQKHTANWSFFGSWSSDMAYVLGFLFADGNVARRYNNVSMAVKESDIALLDQIKRVMQATHPIGVYERSSGPDGERIALLQMHNATLKHDVMALGVIPNKTYCLAFPVVPDEYLRDFTRGYFDGDGSVNLYTDKQRPGYVGLRTTFICHEKHFLEILGGLLKDTIGIIPKIYRLEASWRLQYGGRESVCLYDWMYKHPSVDLFLARKRQVFEDWLSQRGIRDQYTRTCAICSRPFVRISGLQQRCHSCQHAKVESALAGNSKLTSGS